MGYKHTYAEGGGGREGENEASFHYRAFSAWLGLAWGFKKADGGDVRENTRAACETHRSDAAVGEGESRTGKAKPKGGNFSLSQLPLLWEARGWGCTLLEFPSGGERKRHSDKVVSVRGRNPP